MGRNYGTLLVISDNDEQEKEFVDRYDAGRQTKEHIVATIQSASKDRNKLVELLSSALSEPKFPFTPRTRERAENLYREYKGMSDVDFFMSENEGNTIDEKSMIAFSSNNPEGKYHNPFCYHTRLIEQGSQAYRARLKDIDWVKMHGSNRDVYEAAYELCVEGREPKDRGEQGILDRMANRTEYFMNFRDKKEYTDYSTSYCERAVITPDGNYRTNTFAERHVDWVLNFYDRFIKGLDGNPLLAIYEISFD